MLRDKVLTPTQLHKAQKQLLGQIALSQENNLSLAIALGRSLLCYNRIDTIEDVYARISAITAAEALAVANEIFAPEEQTLLIFKAK
jgi:predicted Zn-dependent peptidase